MEREEKRERDDEMMTVTKVVALRRNERKNLSADHVGIFRIQIATTHGSFLAENIFRQGPIVHDLFFIVMDHRLRLWNAPASPTSVFAELSILPSSGALPGHFSVLSKLKTTTMGMGE